MEPDPRRPTQYLLHLILLLLTLFTTTIAGIQWLNKDPFELSNFGAGFRYSLSIMIFLASHEFGHFIAARLSGVSVTLPFFIPVPPFLVNPFGTMGAVIRIRSPFPFRRSLFDIGIAGPLAGFVVTLAILIIGFLTLPPKSYLFTIHPEYAALDSIPKTGLTFGNSLLFWGLCKVFASYAFVPPMNEVYHYPLLCVGWFGLFVTALNMIPVGQLDGGHILYALCGARVQSLVARAFFIFLVAVGLSGFLPARAGSPQIGTLGWLLWALILLFVVKLDHPQLIFQDELTPARKALGWVSFLIFVVSFPPIPFLT